MLISDQKITRWQNTTAQPVLLRQALLGSRFLHGLHWGSTGAYGETAMVVYTVMTWSLVGSSHYNSISSALQETSVVAYCIPRGAGVGLHKADAPITHLCTMTCTGAGSLGVSEWDITRYSQHHSDHFTLNNSIMGGDCTTHPVAMVHISIPWVSPQPQWATGGSKPMKSQNGSYTW